MADNALHAIPGGQALIEWFGFVPNFHDAELQSISITNNGPCTLRIRAFRMTDQVDDRGYYVLDKHVVVTMTLIAVSHVSLTSFDFAGGIFDLQITAVEEGYEVAWAGVCDDEGLLRAKQVRIDFHPEAR
jgi:hypothetical protein